MLSSNCSIANQGAKKRDFFRINGGSIGNSEIVGNTKKRDIGKFGCSKAPVPIIEQKSNLEKGRPFRIMNDEDSEILDRPIIEDADDYESMRIKDAPGLTKWRSRMDFFEAARLGCLEKTLTAADVHLILSGPLDEYMEVRSIAQIRRMQINECRAFEDSKREHSPEVGEIASAMLTATHSTEEELCLMLGSIKCNGKVHEIEAAFMQDLASLAMLLAMKDPNRQEVDKVIESMPEYELYAERKYREIMAIENSGQHKIDIMCAPSLFTNAILLTGIPHGISPASLRGIAEDLDKRTRLGIDIDDLARRVEKGSEIPWDDDCGGFNRIDIVHTIVLKLKSAWSFSVDGAYRTHKEAQGNFPFPLVSSFDHRYQLEGNEFEKRLTGMYTVRIYVQAIKDDRLNPDRIQHTVAIIRGIRNAPVALSNSVNTAILAVSKRLRDSEVPVEIYTEVRSYNVYTANPNYDADKSGPNRPYKNLRDDQVWLKIFIVGADHETGNYASNLRIDLGLRGKPIVITEAGHPFELAIKDDQGQLETPFPNELIPVSSPHCTCVRDLRKGIRTGAVLQGLIEAGLEILDINRCWIQRSTPAFDGSETARDVLYIISNEGLTIPADIISSISSTGRSFRVTTEPGLQEFVTLFSILSLKEQISMRFKSSRRSSSAVTAYGRQNQGRERAGRGGPVMDYSFGSSSVSSMGSMSTSNGGKSYAVAVSSSTSNEVVLRQDRLELTLKSLENSNNELRNELRKKIDDNDTALRDLMTVQRVETDEKLRLLQENIESGLTAKLGELLAPQVLSKTLSSILSKNTGATNARLDSQAATANINTLAMNARLDSQETSMNAKLDSQAAALESQSVTMNTILALLARSLGQSPISAGMQTQPLVMAELAPSLPSKLVSDAQRSAIEPPSPLMADTNFPSNRPMAECNQHPFVDGTNTVSSLGRFAPRADESGSSQESGSEKEAPNLLVSLPEPPTKTGMKGQNVKLSNSRKKEDNKRKSKGSQLRGHGQPTVERYFTPPPACLTEAQFSPSAETTSSSSALEGCPSLARDIFTDDCSSISGSEHSHSHNTRSTKALLSGVDDNVGK